jgi:hypothetical protein
MLFAYIKKRTKFRKQKKIAALVRNGIVPRGVPKDQIFEALTAVRPKNGTEMHGFLSAICHRPDGSLKKDYGLMSIKEITSAFSNHLVDALVLSGAAATFHLFNEHKMGAGSTLETHTLTELVSGQAGAQLASGGPGQGRGATSNIYQSIGTITAGSAYGCREHGVFNASTNGIMLDRSLVTDINLATDDVVTWTYELTVNAGG